MGRSRKNKRHFMDDDQMTVYKSIRKPLTPKSSAHKNRSEKRKGNFNWRDEIDNG